MKNYRTILQQGLISGVRKGMHGFVWMMKILVPISFATALLAWSGLIHKLNHLVQPVMDWLSLPGIAALPLLIGMLTGIYGALAVMVVLPLSKEQMTLIAIFLLIAHNLIQEGAIQGKSGLHPLKATIFRLIAATVTVMISAHFLQVTAAAPAHGMAIAPGAEPLSAVLSAWLLDTLRLSLKIFAIIMSILILLETLKKLGWISHIVRLFRPLLRVLGLNHQAGVLWITAAMFGLAYGAAVIVEEAREGYLPREELEGLHLSIGINHSLIEDPSLFLALGLSPFWLWIPRLITAMVAVRLLSLWQSFARRRI